MRSTRNLIVGGGLAGLGVALHLEDSDFVLAEKHARVGGLCRSIYQFGFTFDHAGHIFFTRDPYVDGLFRDILGDNFHEQDRESWVCLYDAYLQYPFQSNLFGLPPEVIEECVLGFLDAWRRRRASSGSDGGTDARTLDFRTWCYQTFGAGITEHFMIPYNRKVWGVAPESMSCDWIDGRVHEPSLEEVVLGAIRPGRGRVGPNARFGYPLRGGCEAFVAGLARRVQARGGGFAPRRRLARLDPKGRRATFRVEDGGARSRIESIRYEKLFPSVPLPELIGLIDDAPDPVRRAAADLPTTSLICVNLGIGRGDVTEKHWIYYPENQDKYIFQRIFVQSNASPFAAPPGCSALSFEISYSPTKPLPVRGRRALVAACVAGLKRTDLWRDGDEIVFDQVLGLPHAYIPFTPDRSRNLDIIIKYLNGLSIHPVGRFGEWKYLNQDGAILSAKRVVEALRRD